MAEKSPGDIVHVRRALVSVFDKAGVVEFAKTLNESFDVQIISTGGTARALSESNVPVTLVEALTGFGEMLDGRVKTLHPKIHAGLLADRDNPDHVRQLDRAGIGPIDMVVVNLYAFEATVGRTDCRPADAIEMIDIGGPCLLRAAAKNHRHVVTVCDPVDYQTVIDELRSNRGTSLATRQRLACKAFALTSRYDAAIVDHWAQVAPQAQTAAPSRGGRAAIYLSDRQPLRYGENPHQSAGLWRIERSEGLCENDDSGLGVQGVAAARKLAGEELSYNNYVDAEAAHDLCAELTAECSRDASPAYPCLFIKHTNPCGAGIAEDPIEAYRRAYLGDPNAAMGGILACGFGVDAEFAGVVMESLARWGKQAGAGAFFVEVWIAPSFTPDAIERIVTSKAWGKRVRLLASDALKTSPRDAAIRVRQVGDGMLVQTADPPTMGDEWNVASARRPSESESRDLRMAWTVCKHAKSNAITVVKDRTLLGSGVGQMSRVMSCRIAVWAARENGHADELSGAVAASDAFFPFRDGPDILLEAGVRAIVQPGGSKRDDETIAACKEHDAALVLTGRRHFRH